MHDPGSYYLWTALEIACAESLEVKNAFQSYWREKPDGKFDFCAAAMIINAKKNFQNGMRHAAEEEIVNQFKL